MFLNDVFYVFNEFLFIFTFFFSVQDLIASWRTIALRDRARTEPNALPKTIRTNVRALRGSRAPRAPKTSRNVRPPNPAYTDIV